MYDDDLPEPYARLRELLFDLGYELSKSSAGRLQFGNEVLLFLKGRVAFRLVRDRSQWFVEIAAPNSDEWFGPVVWKSLLLGEQPLENVDKFDEINFIFGYLAEIERISIEADPLTNVELSRLRATRAQRQRSAKTVDSQFPYVRPEVGH